MSNRIQYYYEVPVAWFKNRNKLKRFILTIFRNENKKIESIRIIFCSDSYLLKINRIFLNHDFFTDIVTFNLTEHGSALEAEIYISIDRVRDNADQHNKSWSNELHRVIFHGMLHLLGYKDKLKREKLEMRRMEDRYLARYFRIK